MSIRHVAFLCKSQGLANRLRALCAYQALARCRGVRDFLCWIPDSACNANFCDIFENAEYLIPLHELEKLHRVGAVEIYSATDWGDEIWRSTCADFIPWSIFLEHYRAAFSAINVRKELVAQAKTFADEWRLACRLGVHIRNTDNISEYERWAVRSSHKFDIRQISKMEGFEREMDHWADKASIFLATDHDEIEKKFKARYGARIVTWPKTFLPISGNRRARSTTIEVALMDMLLLGACRHILGTYYSSFSRLSAILGRRGYCEVQSGNRVEDPPIPSGVGLLRNRFFADG